MPSCVCFRNCLIFLIICWPVEETHWRDVDPSKLCRTRLRRMDSSDCGAYCCVEGVYLSIESHFFFSESRMQQGSKIADREMSRADCRSCVAAQRHCGRQTRSTTNMISGTLHVNLRLRIWNTAIFTKTEFASLLRIIVSSPTKSKEAHQQRLKAWFLNGKVGRL